MAIGKTAPNGTLNADGAFYSVQDVNVLLENAGGGGGADLPTPTVADAGSVVVVGDDGKYALGEAGGSDSLFIVTITEDGGDLTADKTFAEILSALEAGKIIIYSVFGVNVLANCVGGTPQATTSLGGTVAEASQAEGETNKTLYVTTYTIYSDNSINIIDYTAQTE